jgi:NADH dehydrogenase/NADH:ubiquinone oxidoreductase subunit G
VCWWLPPADAAHQASRCLHCDCRSLDACRLRHYAAQYGADANRFRGTRRRLERIERSGVIFEPGKCIVCGLCVQIASRAGEPLGLAFVGRGFDVRIGVPFNRTLEEALTRVARQCIAACPTAALAMNEEADASLPILDQR